MIFNKLNTFFPQSKHKYPLYCETSKGNEADIDECNRSLKNVADH